jgi:hypothetical protein
MKDYIVEKFQNKTEKRYKFSKLVDKEDADNLIVKVKELVGTWSLQDLENTKKSLQSQIDEIQNKIDSINAINSIDDIK